MKRMNRWNGSKHSGSNHHGKRKFEFLSYKTGLRTAGALLAPVIAGGLIAIGRRTVRLLHQEKASDQAPAPLVGATPAGGNAAGIM